MGEIADGIINGDFDCVSGEWLGEGDGYPRTAEPNHPNSISQGHSNSSQINGVLKFLRNNTQLEVKEYKQYCVDYLNNELKLNFTVEHDTWDSIATVLQNDFKPFAKYVRAEFV